MTSSGRETPGTETPHAPAGCFVTTHWSVVVAAGRSDTTRAHAALEKLCRAYWFPLYAYARRRGYSVEDAQDLTQEFFARVLEHHWLARADQARGRFRTFLLTAMERFMANEWDKVRALKRGGGQRNVPIQLDTAETRYGVEPADTQTPEQAFEYRWAVALLDEVVGQLEAEFRARDQVELFTTLKPCLVGDRASQPYAELAARLRMEEGAVKVAVHRLRQRYRELLRAEIANTVDSPGEVDAEMRHLFNVLARSA
ncbi:MAG TPA: sigma-70 family RNA polymerase sigma factor [Candidatus Paceibacterota bacterium]|nr:sigma-70 family RNA polymerase sigma factor [Verrucomicrobiota bacterium]HSA11140.1 sigma-70 family RNA polymerase sigma factor [Candidatus Paceibacterota bacterium]